MPVFPCVRICRGVKERAEKEVGVGAGGGGGGGGDAGGGLY